MVESPGDIFEFSTFDNQEEVSAAETGCYYASILKDTWYGVSMNEPYSIPASSNLQVFNRFNNTEFPRNEDYFPFLCFADTEPGADAIKEVGIRYGVQASTSDDGRTHKLFLEYNGQKIELKIDFSKELSPQLEELVQAKQKELTEKFGITFSKKGERINNPRGVPEADWQGKKDKELLLARAPRLDELLALEASLQCSDPSIRAGQNKSAVHMIFLDEHFERRSSSTVAEYVPNANQKPSLIVYGPKTAGRLITELDRKGKPEFGVEEFSLQRVMVHELSHHHQFTTSWKQSTVPKDILNGMGWVENKGQESNAPNWLLSDKEGKLYRFVEPGSLVCIGKEFLQMNSSSWIRCNEKGEFLDGKDKSVLAPSAMRDKAKTKPVNQFFNNPFEMHAEALTAYRLNSQWRQHLFKTDPEFYKAIKHEDQKAIDEHYGKGKLIRNADGRLVENSDSNRQLLADFENKLETKR